MSELFNFANASTTLETAVPSRIISGNPVTTYQVHTSDADGRLTSGTWSATPGAWQVLYTEWEFCQIISGRGSLSETDGATVAIGPGDAFTLSPGFEGIWTVDETMTKNFVILDPPL